MSSDPVSLGPNDACIVFRDTGTMECRLPDFKELDGGSPAFYAGMVMHIFGSDEECRAVRDAVLNWYCRKITEGLPPHPDRDAPLPDKGADRIAEKVIEFYSSWGEMTDKIPGFFRRGLILAIAMEMARDAEIEAVDA